MNVAEPSRDLIALTLAIGLCTALNLIVIAILWDAIHDPNQAGISENATQILTGWGGGIIGILGAVFGYRAGAAGAAAMHEADQSSYQPPSRTEAEPDE